MTHQRNRHHLYKYLYQWKVQDDRSGFNHYAADMSKEFGKFYIETSDLDTYDYTFDSASLMYQPRTNQVYFTNKLEEGYVDNVPPSA